MFFATSRLSLLAILMLASAGCLQSQLRKNTIVQMQTVHDIQQQQVLDNLAMFVHDINSYPYFSLVAGGTTELTETGSLAVTNGWSRGVGGFLYNSLGINPTVSCTSQGNWQVNPINDSIKLTVMRCVYQKAVSGCCGRQLPANCPDCNAMLKYYYPWETFAVSENESRLGSSSASPTQLLPPPQPSANKSSPAIANDDKFGVAAAKEGGPPHDNLHGMITPNCIPTDHCWFCWGCKKDVPKDCTCLPVGHYCDTYVWVPMEGRDELSKLTLLILDIAYYDPPTPGKPLVNASGPYSAAPAFSRSRSPLPYTMLQNAQTIQDFSPQQVVPAQ
jgi:hypothetical protein